MKHLEINGIKNKSDDWEARLIDENKQYIAEFMKKHKGEFLKNHFEIFLDLDFLRHMLSYRSSFFNMLLDLSEKDTVKFLDNLINFIPFTKEYYVSLYDMQINKMEINGTCLENIKLVETDVDTLICSPTSNVKYMSFCQALVHSKINKLIITNVNLNKELAEVDEDVKRILDRNSSTIKEVIVE
jgi:hypothetical protein